MQNRIKALFVNLRFDLPASLVVALVALPLCLGIAVASGAPPFAGLIAGIVGGVVVGTLSKSSVSVSGPAAGLTVIVAGAIESLPSYEIFLTAVCLAGLLQMGLAAARAGVIGDFIPSSVIKGMLAAIGCLLIFKQLPHVIGGGAAIFKDENGFMEILATDIHAAFEHFVHQHLSPGALLIAGVSLPFLFFWDTIHARLPGLLRYVPGPLIVVIFGVAANEFFKTSFPELALGGDLLVKIPVSDSASDFVKNFRFPDLSAIKNLNVWAVAVTLALVASVETLLCIEAADKLDPRKRLTPTNRELAAQGVGNVVSGMLGGLPVTSVIVRSSANVLSGARTKISAISHGVLLLICVTMVPFLLNKIPLAALAAVLVAVGYKLVKPALFKDEFKKGMSHFVPFCVTIVAILATDLLAGIAVGLLCSAMFMASQNFRSSVMLMSDQQNYLLRCRKDLYFIHKHALKQALQRVPDHAALIIDASRASFIDKDNVDIIKQFLEEAPHRGIRVTVRGHDFIFGNAAAAEEQRRGHPGENVAHA